MNTSVYKLQNGVYGPDCRAGVNPAVSMRQLRAGDRMKQVTCIICKNEFSIPPWDYRYKELKHNRRKPCVCDLCGCALQKEAMIISGLSPEDLDKLDRMDKVIR